MDNSPIAGIGGVTAVDVVVLLVLFFSGVFAYFRGFVGEVLSVAAWVGAGLAVVFGLPYAQPLAHRLIKEPMIADVTAGVALFMGALLVLSILTHSISRHVHASAAFGPVDRAMGFLFGLLRGALVICLLNIAIEWMMPPESQPVWLKGARTMPTIVQGSRWLWSFVPESAAKAARDKTDAAREAGEKARQTLENARQMNEILTPKPKGDDARRPEGYSPRERQDLDQLLQRSR
jgi:membrane protein required for colicin V production